VNIDPTTTVSSISTSAASTGGLQGTQDEFLKLFMAQLQNQDPLDPKDGADMVAQLAQFSSVEQQTQTNAQLQAMAASQSSSANASLSSLVGRQCDANVGTVHVDNANAVPPIDVSSTGTIQGGSIVVTDASGKEVRRMPIPTGGGVVQWDGKTASGMPVAEGDYKISVDPGTSAATVTAKWSGHIDSLELTSSGSRLRMGGVLLNPSDITTIGAL